MAIANLIAAITDTMRTAEVPGEIVHGFLDRLERMNAVTLWGTPAELLGDIVDVVRRTVPGNDE